MLLLDLLAKMAELPKDLVRDIIQMAALGADACVELRRHGAVPKRLVISPDIEEKLDRIFMRKLYDWKQNANEDLDSNEFPITLYDNTTMIATGLYVKKNLELVVELYMNKTIYTVRKYVVENFDDTLKEYTISMTSYDIHTGKRFMFFVESYNDKPDFESWVYDSEEKEKLNIDQGFKKKLDTMFKHRAFVYKYRQLLPSDQFWKIVGNSSIKMENGAPVYVKYIQFMIYNSKDHGYSTSYSMIKSIVNNQTGNVKNVSIINHNIHTGQESYRIEENIDNDIVEIEFEYVNSEPERVVNVLLYA